MLTFLMTLILLNSGPVNDTGEISGTVLTQEHEQAFPGVLIEMYQEGELVNTTFSDSKGQFRFSEIPAGDYDLTFKFVGKKKKRLKAVHVEANNVTTLNLIYPKARRK